MHTHTCTHLLPLSYTLFIAASGRCVIYISLSRAQLCACVFFYVCVLFFFLLMHRVVILWHFFPCTQQSFKPCGSPLLGVFSLPTCVSWVCQACPAETKTNLSGGCLDGDFQILPLKTLVQNPDVRKSVIKMKWSFSYSFVPDRRSRAGAKWYSRDTPSARARVSHCVRFVFNLSQRFNHWSIVTKWRPLTWGFSLTKENRLFHHHKAGLLHFKCSSIGVEILIKHFPSLKCEFKRILVQEPLFFLLALRPSISFEQFLPVCSFYFLPVYICLHLFFSTASNFLRVSHIQLSLLWPPSSNPAVLSPTSSTCAAALQQTGTDGFWPPFNRQAAHRPVQTALIGSDSKYVPWNWLGMHVRECVCVGGCVFVCVCASTCVEQRQRNGGLLLWGKQNKKESVTKI